MKLELCAKESTFYYKMFEIIIPLSKGLSIHQDINEMDLRILRNRIDDLLGHSEIIETFHCSMDEAEKITQYWNGHKKCDTCSLRLKECYRCTHVCESPLERALLMELVGRGVDVELQFRINKDNSTSHYPEPVVREKILTIPDFYLEKGDKKICIYTDGHTYHERTEYQAMRDRSIDRELQGFGYTVLRFTGKEIRQKMENVIESINKAIDQ